METKIMRVVQQGDVLTVQSTKSEGGTLKNATSSFEKWAENSRTPTQRSCSEQPQN